MDSCFCFSGLWGTLQIQQLLTAALAQVEGVPIYGATSSSMASSGSQVYSYEGPAKMRRKAPESAAETTLNPES